MVECDGVVEVMWVVDCVCSVVPAGQDLRLGQWLGLNAPYGVAGLGAV